MGPSPRTVDSTSVGVKDGDDKLKISKLATVAYLDTKLDSNNDFGFGGLGFRSRGRLDEAVVAADEADEAPDGVERANETRLGVLGFWAADFLAMLYRLYHFRIRVDGDADPPCLNEYYSRFHFDRVIDRVCGVDLNAGELKVVNCFEH